jgi:pantoate--beta-alanine ligase
MFARPPHLVLEKIETIAGLRARLGASSSPNPAVRGRALVPTMGALHAGHAELIRTARRQCQIVVVSVFVNPLQFDDRDDLARYPRTLDADEAMCRELGVDIVFQPSPAEIYPMPPECTIDVGRLGDHLCGKFRPGHFRGVATIVMKLFQIVQPDRAYFGEKDAQQLAIVRRLASDFNIPIEIVEVPTAREPDGLAMSSRNARLSPDQRALAASLYRALLEARRLIASGARSAAEVTQAAAALVPRSDILKLEYLEIVDPATMQPLADIDRDVRVAGAIWVGKTRLIDNLLVRR